MQELRDNLADLAEQGTTYLGRVVGEQTLLSVQKVRSSPVYLERIPGFQFSTCVYMIRFYYHISLDQK